MTGIRYDVSEPGDRDGFGKAPTEPVSVTASRNVDTPGRYEVRTHNGVGPSVGITPASKDVAKRRSNDVVVDPELFDYRPLSGGGM